MGGGGWCMVVGGECQEKETDGGALASMHGIHILGGTEFLCCSLQNPFVMQSPWFSSIFRLFLQHLSNTS